MKKLERHSDLRGGRPLRWAVLACGLLLCAFTGAAWATNNTGSGGGGGSGGFSADDETVGTLPSYGPGNGLDLYRLGVALRPSLCLQGRIGDIQNALVWVRGDPRAVVESVGPEGMVRITLLGDVQVMLDRSYVATGDVVVALAVPRAPVQIIAGPASARSLVDLRAGPELLTLTQIAAP
jgi:hypothetical protein